MKAILLLLLSSLFCLHNRIAPVRAQQEIDGKSINFIVEFQGMEESLGLSNFVAEIVVALRNGLPSHESTLRSVSGFLHGHAFEIYGRAMNRMIMAFSPYIDPTINEYGVSLAVEFSVPGFLVLNQMDNRMQYWPIAYKDRVKRVDGLVIDFDSGIMDYLKGKGDLVKKEIAYSYQVVSDNEVFFEDQGEAMLSSIVV